MPKRERIPGVDRHGNPLAYADDILPNRSGYAPADRLAAAWDAGVVSRAWRLGPRLVSVRLSPDYGGGLWKNRDRLLLTEPDRQLAALAAAGVHFPSSWGDCYHQLAPPAPRVLWTFNGLLAWWPGGPWSEARRTGEFRGKWYRYDLQGAYRWAATWGLPDPATFRVVTDRRGGRPGVFVCTTREERPDLPPLFRERGARVVATHEEIESYNLAVDYIRGVTWSAEYPANYVERTLQKLPFPKDAGRAYWGRWIARDRLTCWTASSEWELPNLHTNFVWGWLIVSRVRFRVWEAAQEAAHVYVDEVLVPHELPTGGEGHWKLKQEYPDGVIVRRTGWYGDIRDNSPTMKTGVKRS